MTLAERMAVSYSHVSDEFSSEFIKSLHRAQGSSRLIVRHPNRMGKPYGVSEHGYRIRVYLLDNPEDKLSDITEDIIENGDDSMKTLHSYYLKHWS